MQVKYSLHVLLSSQGIVVVNGTSPAAPAPATPAVS